MSKGVGTITFHRREGDEVFRLESATIQAIRDENGVELCFAVQAEEGPIKPLPETVEFPTQPNAEVSVFVKEFDVQRLAGSRFQVPRSYDEEREDHVSCVYYYDHQDFDNIVVEVLARRGKRFQVRWTGTTDDGDAYDGSEPPNRVAVEGMFEFLGIEEP